MFHFHFYFYLEIKKTISYFYFLRYNRDEFQEKSNIFYVIFWINIWLDVSEYFYSYVASEMLRKMISELRKIK